MEMRQKQNQLVQIEWPEVMYLTPSEWGNETFVLTREELRETVRSLRQLGEDWRDVSEDDATPYHLSEVRGEYAIYERRGRVGVERVRVLRHLHPGGVWYEWGPVEVEG